MYHPRSVRITARCTYCARRFTPTINPDGSPAIDDEEGRICCDGCLHSVCCVGHATQEQIDACAQDYADDMHEARTSYDPDIWLDYQLETRDPHDTWLDCQLETRDPVAA